MNIIGIQWEPMLCHSSSAFWLSIRIRFSLRLTTREHVFMKCWYSSGPCITPCQPLSGPVNACTPSWITFCSKDSFIQLRWCFSPITSLLIFFLFNHCESICPPGWILTTFLDSTLASTSCYKFTDSVVAAFQLDSEVWQGEFCWQHGSDGTGEVKTADRHLITSGESERISVIRNSRLGDTLHHL